MAMKHCVLVVRPQKQAVSLLNYCQQQGWHTELFSSLEVQTLSHTHDSVQAALNASDVVFWASANAIASAKKLGVVPPLRNVCVGQATLQVFYRHFPHSVALAPDDGLDSEAVLRLPLWQDASLRRVLIVNGEGGRKWLTHSLMGLGKSVQTLSVYQRVPVAVDWERFRQITQTYICVVCVYSRESAAQLFEQVPVDLRERLQSLLYLTIHERIAESLRDLGVNRVLVGQNGHEDVLQLLHEHAKN